MIYNRWRTYNATPRTLVTVLKQPTEGKAENENRNAEREGLDTGTD